MNEKARRIGGGILAVACLLVLGGCLVPGKVTGGGTLASANPASDKTASFGFSANGCDPMNLHGSFTYHDRGVPESVAPSRGGGLKIKGAVVGAGLCQEEDQTGPECICLIGEYQVDVVYRSTNPFTPGNGNAIACVLDNGEGFQAITADNVFVGILTGPYAGYTNENSVSGNIQAHRCD